MSRISTKAAPAYYSLRELLVGRPDGMRRKGAARTGMARRDASDLEGWAARPEIALTSCWDRADGRWSDR